MLARIIGQEAVAERIRSGRVATLRGTFIKTPLASKKSRSKEYIIKNIPSGIADKFLKFLPNSKASKEFEGSMR
jgi:hypothetical protein